MRVVAAAENAAQRVPVGDSRPAPCAALAAARGGNTGAHGRHAAPAGFGSTPEGSGGSTAEDSGASAADEPRVLRRRSGLLKRLFALLRRGRRPLIDPGFRERSAVDAQIQP